MEHKQVHENIERLCNLMRNETRLQCKCHGLQPVQLDALRYLRMCNRFSDTPVGVAEFLGLTKGTISQSLKQLEHKGFVKKQADKTDRRSVHLKLTTWGRKLLQENIPAPVIDDAYDALDNRERKQLADGLKSLLANIQERNDMKSYGVCKTCRYNSKLSDEEYYCQLNEENLTLHDVELICREHSYAG